jgi:glycine/D-amino acid oxidase-like deaminating enzyme
LHASRLAPGFKTSPWRWEAADPPRRGATLPDRAAVLVVGGGYAGLAAAVPLRRLGRALTVLDAGRIGWGASSRNGGVVAGGLQVARHRGCCRRQLPLHRGDHRAGGDRLRLCPLHGYLTACFPELRDVHITHAWTGYVAFSFDHLPPIRVQDGIHDAPGCQGSGGAMATWRGHNLALQAAAAANRALRVGWAGLSDPALLCG